MSTSSNSEPKIIAETTQFIWVDKPAHWLTIPGRPFGQGKDLPTPGQEQSISLLNSSSGSPVLSDWLKAKGYRPLVVHRLDRETSGILLFAKTAKDHQIANTWFQTRRVKKIYYCLAGPTPELPLFKISSPIAGAPSSTHVEVKKDFGQGFLARVSPRTGRRHQIRIHFSKNGFPIWGDTRYQGPRYVEGGGRPKT